MKFGIVDFHCDALSKLQLNPELHFGDDPGLDVTASKLKKGGVQLQCFAIYLSEQLGQARIGLILEQIALYRTKVESCGLPLITSRQQLAALAAAGETGAMLSIEGADGLEGHFGYLQCCYDLGVRFLGLTWNHANWAADGVMEPRGRGFTAKGKQLVEACHDLGIILDVSHLSQQGFWELTEMAESAGRPFIASHSNSHSICKHPRNLTDEQIRAIVRLGGRIGLTFVPPFVKTDSPVKMTDLLPHIEHMCACGAENNLMFGSDFDGIDEHIEGLENAAGYSAFKDMLLKYYAEPLVDKWLAQNALKFLQTHLPSTKKAF